MLDDFKLTSYFPVVIESAVVGVRKPDPAIFRLGVEALALQPEEVVVIGDSYRKDIQPAQSLGCDTIWIKGAGRDDSEAAVQHDKIITDIAQLQELL